MKKLPCEEAIWYTLPAIRADIAKRLVKDGMSQKEVAEKLGVTAAAISQYLNKKRGSKSDTPKDYGKLIDDATEKIKKGPADDDVIARLLCQCCARSREPKSK